ncbi:MAG: Acetyl-/propionyl-coenzyme A carboxylase alpha chain [Pseudomonas fluorescens]|nr:MAG: Acetyl-/propionyl-coenzyme A carboxylase alpha chain [Pseudomonas fluorescens]
MTPELRRAMGEAALTAARAVDYVGAGTVEFLLDGNGRFYFLEMNTRLQVEHPVTERVTGLDLVAWQLNVAAGLPLPLQQQDVTLNGHAMEVRLYAEDPAQDFMPQTGEVLRWQPPEQVRVDHAVVEGQTVSPFYDPMLAKIIAHGATREEARRKLLRAVEDCVLLGVGSNQALLADLLRHPGFVSGDFGTGFIAEHFARIPSVAVTDERLAIAAALFYQQGARAHAPGLSGWRNNVGEPWSCQLAVQGKTLTVGLDARITVEADGGYAKVVCEGIVRRLPYHLQGTELWLAGLLISDQTHAITPREAQTGNGIFTAPMDGAIVQMEVGEGDSVSEGQLLLVLEAMKTIKATASGVVKRVQVTTGDQVRHRQILLEIT